MLLLRSTDPAASAWWTYGGGAILGLGLVVKIWDIVPVLIVLGWLTVTSGRGAAVRASAPAAVTATATLLPFGVEAGSRMLRLVVLDQLGRPRGSADLAARRDSAGSAASTSTPVRYRPGVGPCSWPSLSASSS